MDCVRCLKLHGPGCPAAANVDGEDLCVWCLDGIPCARAQRLVKQLRSAAHDPLRFATANANDVLIAAAARKNSVTTAARPNGHDVTAASMPVIVLCKISGCGRKLEADDQGGLCRDHRRIRHNGADRSREMKALRAAAVQQKPPANGHDPAHGANGNDDLARSLGAAARATCKAPGCRNKLSLNNASGFCQVHARNARAAAAQQKPPANGHDPAHNDVRSLGAAASSAGKLENRRHLETPHPAGLSGPSKPQVNLPATAGRSNGHDVTTDREENSIMSSTSAPTTSAPPAPARRCKHRDGSGSRARCTTELSIQTKSDYCADHRDLHAKGSSNGNGHGGHRAKPNGSGKTNGNAAADSPQKAVIAKRVRLMLDAVDLLPVIDELLQVIPIEDKQRFVERWLTGAA